MLAVPEMSSERIFAMTEVYSTDRASLERDCDMEFFIASGPGGQHRNKVATAVRLTHRPSGTVVTATERRSQYANREAAFARMAARLQAMQPDSPAGRASCERNFVLTRLWA